MKVYKNFDEVQETLIKHNMADDAVMISRVGLPDEQVFIGLDNMPKDTKLNYYLQFLQNARIVNKHIVLRGNIYEHSTDSTCCHCWH